MHMRCIFNGICPISIVYCGVRLVYMCFLCVTYMCAKGVVCAMNVCAYCVCCIFDICVVGVCLMCVHDLGGGWDVLESV